VAEEHVRELNLAVRRLLQSGREMQSAAARQLGLRITDVQAMDLVTAADGRISPAELADRLGIRTASASVLIDRLVAAGHLERAKAERAGNSQPRRRVRVAATPHARTEIRQALKDVNDGFDELARDLTPEQAAAVLTFLERGTQILRAYADSAHEDQH
jgi:DNA-binding MarR family transcriptional regulator